jgi:two-component system NtrC family sensor kinase
MSMPVKLSVLIIISNYEGTGLGLSLTYDMVVKGHGGSISVETKEGEGSAFIIQLPIT